MTIGWVSTFNTKCGIATYSEHTLQSIRKYDKQIIVFAEHSTNLVDKDSDNVVRCWNQGFDTLENLFYQILNYRIKTLVIQFHQGLFNSQCMDRFIFNVKKYDIRLIFMIHSMPNQIPANISICDVVTVQIKKHYDTLKEIYTKHNFRDNLVVHQHGLHLPTIKNVSRQERSFPVIGCFGFSFPHKGIYQLLQSMVMLRNANFLCKLRLINAEYPAPISSDYVANCKQFIVDNNLQDCVEYRTDFLTDLESEKILSECDFLINPYQYTLEPTSGSVRHMLSLGLPVAVTPSPIFDDIRDVTYQISGMEPQNIYDSIFTIWNSIKTKDDTYVKLIDNSQKWLYDNSYDALSIKFMKLLGE